MRVTGRKREGLMCGNLCPEQNRLDVCGEELRSRRKREGEEKGKEKEGERDRKDGRGAKRMNVLKEDMKRGMGGEERI